MDGPKPSSISPQDLYGAIGTHAAPVVIDVRRSAVVAVRISALVGAAISQSAIQQRSTPVPSMTIVLGWANLRHEPTLTRPLGIQSREASDSPGISLKGWPHRVRETLEEVRFARDSPLEQPGFEPPVPSDNDARRSGAVARRRGARGRTVRSAPYPRYPPTARVVFSRSGRAARS